MQSIVLSVALIVFDIVMMVLVRIPVLGMIFGLVSMLVGLACFVLWIIMLIKALTGVEWEIPYIGKQARKFLKTASI